MLGTIIISIIAIVVITIVWRRNRKTSDVTHSELKHNDRERRERNIAKFQEATRAHYQAVSPSIPEGFGRKQSFVPHLIKS